MRTIFALYKGDEYLDMGTAQELANKLEVKTETIKFYATPTNHKRNPNGLVAIRVEDD